MRVENDKCLEARISIVAFADCWHDTFQAQSKQIHLKVVRIVSSLRQARGHKRKSQWLQQQEALWMLVCLPAFLMKEDSCIWTKVNIRSYFQYSDLFLLHVWGITCVQWAHTVHFHIKSEWKLWGGTEVKNILHPCTGSVCWGSLSVMQTDHTILF